MEDFHKHMHVQVWHQWLQKFLSSLMLNIAHIRTETYSCRIHMPAQQDKLLHSHCCSMIWPVTMNNAPLHSYKETTGEKKRNQKVKRGRNKDFLSILLEWQAGGRSSPAPNGWQTVSLLNFVFESIHDPLRRFTLALIFSAAFHV